MRKILKMLLGAALFFAAMWGGAYVLSILERQSWMWLPGFFTALVIGVAGAFLFIDEAVGDI
jgi:hypothetical protein